MTYLLRFRKGDEFLNIDTTVAAVAEALTGAATRNGFVLVAKEYQSANKSRSDSTATAYAPPLLPSEAEEWERKLAPMGMRGWNANSIERVFKLKPTDGKRVLYWLQKEGIVYFDKMSRMYHVADAPETRQGDQEGAA